MEIKRKTLLETGIAVVLVFLVIHYWDSGVKTVQSVLSAASPLVFGCVTAFIINILMSFYEHRLGQLRSWILRRRATKAGKGGKKPADAPCRWLRPLCLALAFITLLLVIYLILIMIIPELIRCFNILLEAVPNAIRTVGRWAEETFNISGLVSNALKTWQDDTSNLQSPLETMLPTVAKGAGSVMNVVFTATSSVVSLLVTLFLGLIFSIHLLLGKDRLASQSNRLMDRVIPGKWLTRLRHVLRTLKDCFRTYIVCQVTEGLILGGLCALGMLILGLPYALMIGCLIGVTALIPIAGAYIGGGIGAIMIFSVNPTQALIFVIYLVVLQQIEGNLIYPRVAGSSLGLPGIWVLAAITLGGGLMGIPGMLIGVPLTTACYRLLREYVNRREPKTAG